MALIYLSLGSNIERHMRIGAALDALAEHFGELILSSVYESDSVGFQGDNFLNLVVGIYSESSLSEVSITLKQIENDNGRDRSAPPKPVKNEPYKTHLAYVKERRTEAEANKVLDIALKKIRGED